MFASKFPNIEGGEAVLNGAGLDGDFLLLILKQ